MLKSGVVATAALVSGEIVHVDDVLRRPWGSGGGISLPDLLLCDGCVQERGTVGRTILLTGNRGISFDP